MVYRRIRRARKNAKARKWLARKMVKRTFTPRKHFFCETFQAALLKINKDGVGTPTTVGQVYTAAISSFNDFLYYKALYRNYRIRRLEWIIMPRWGNAEPNQAEANLGSASLIDTNNAFHYRKTWAGDLAGAATEEDMLLNNGVKTVMLNGQRCIRIRMNNPITQEYIETNVNGSTQLMAPVKNRWCSFDDAVPPQHGGLLTYVATTSSGPLGTVGQQIASVYCKVYFEVSSPR